MRALSTNPRRLNQQQLSELRAQVEELQKAPQEQGGKPQDVSAASSPPGPPSRPPVTLLSLPTAARCPGKSTVSMVAPGAPSTFTPWISEIPSRPVPSAPQPTVLKRKLDEHL